MKKILSVVFLMALSNVALADTIDTPDYNPEDYNPNRVWFTCDAFGGATSVKVMYSPVALVLADANGSSVRLVLAKVSGGLGGETYVTENKQFVLKTGIHNIRLETADGKLISHCASQYYPTPGGDGHYYP